MMSEGRGRRCSTGRGDEPFSNTFGPSGWSEEGDCEEQLERVKPSPRLHRGLLLLQSYRRRGAERVICHCPCESIASDGAQARLTHSRLVRSQNAWSWAASYKLPSIFLGEGHTLKDRQQPGGAECLSCEAQNIQSPCSQARRGSRGASLRLFGCPHMRGRL